MDHDYSSVVYILSLCCLWSQSLCAIHRGICVWDVLELNSVLWLLFCVFVKVNTFLVLYDIKCVSGVSRAEGQMRGRTVSQSGANTHQAFSGHVWEICVFFHLAKANPSHPLPPCFHLPQGLKEIKCLSGTPCQIKHLLSICITSLCLSPRLLEVSPPPCVPALAVWPLIAFSLLHKSPLSAQKWACFGGPLPVKQCRSTTAWV